MDNKLSFKNAAPVNTNAKVTRLEYGKHESVTILGVEGFTPEGKSPYIALKVGNGSADHTEKLYLSEGAMPFTMRNLQLIAKATGVSLPEEFSVSELNNALVGKKMSLTLNGEEYTNAGGDIRVKAVFGYYPFCASEGKTSDITSPTLKKLKTDNAPEGKSGDIPF